MGLNTTKGDIGWVEICHTPERKIQTAHFLRIGAIWVCVLTPCDSFFTSNVRVGLNVGTSNKNNKKGSSSLHYCTGKHEQLLHHLYVDYFQSSGPCVSPDGSRLYPFKSDQYDYDEGGNIMCDRMPRVCQLLARPRGRSILHIGQKMLETLGNNAKSLYNVLTGRATSTTSSNPSDPRLFKQPVLQSGGPIVYPQECDYGQCGDGYGVRVCESIDDVVFPMLGISALTNTTVNIIQTFPDLLQPVFFRRCRSRQAQVVYGECIQEYLPISLLVSPHHPGAVLAQDFVLVESGCHVAAHLTHYHAKTDDAYISPNADKVDTQDTKGQTKTQLEDVQETTQVYYDYALNGPYSQTRIPSRMRDSDRSLF